MASEALRTVLYVDDDPDICEIVQTTLCVLAGLEVRIAHSGSQAIDLAYDWRPDLILMDVMMPRLDGPATLREMRKHALLAGIPVAFLTAKVMPAEVARLIDLGAIGVLEKPFDPEHLCDDIKNLWDAVPTPPAIATSALLKPGAPSPGASLTASFLARAQRDVVRLRELVERGVQGDGTVLRDIEWVAHSLHGSAAMFGFPQVSTVSGVIERLMEASASWTPGAESARTWQTILSSTDRLAREVAAAEHAGPDGNAILHDRGLR